MSIGHMTKHGRLGLSDEQAAAIYETMMLARRIDERCLLLQRAGKAAFHISGIGQEAAQAGAAFALKMGRDFLFPYYRDYALVLKAGLTPRDLMLSIFSKAEDPTSGGRQMPAHFSSKRLNIPTSSSPVTTQVPHAVGFALAAKMQNREDTVAFATFGEGSSNQGDFHEGCNFAGVMKLPVILMCENNQYAISIPAHKQVAGRIVDRAIGYGFPGVRVDGNDVLEMYRVVKEARERAVRGEGPTLIEAVTYRIMPHSTADNDLLYRTKEEIDEHRGKDAIPHYRQYLTECGLWDDAKEQALEDRLRQEINEATSYAERAPYPSGDTLLRHVFAETNGEG